MKRRDFIKKVGLTTAGAIVAPYILPSGRLFAATGNRKVNHVVFCMLAGGIRNNESVKQQEGNLMSTMLKDVSGGYAEQPGFLNVDDISANPLGGRRLQEFGSLLKDVRFAEGPTGHYNGHITALTGRYTTANLNLRSNPDYPTIFEYYRKHAGDSAMSALNAWWISDSLGPYPGLNYSSYPGYGAGYGANFMQPSSLISNKGYNAIGNPLNFTADEKLSTEKIRSFCDGNFAAQFSAESVGVVNSIAEREQLELFLNELFNDSISGAGFLNWGGSGWVNSDLTNVYYTEKVLEKFKPELTVLNLQAVDICHSNFTKYCTNLVKADWGVSHLWNFIQSTPGLANDTVMIVMPEHGRNSEPNTVVDAYGRPAYDHTSDDNSREVFSMILGPDNVIKQDHEISSLYGESIDIAPTIANLLGFDVDIPSGLLPGKVLTDVYA
ncbi:hypothetical protein N8089_02940 [Flavobacteriales bacterium]|nr:hypothetical protein [Flavobacteriales bacterium]